MTRWDLFIETLILIIYCVNKARGNTLPLLPLPLSMPTPLLLPTMTYMLKSPEGYTNKVLRAAAGPTRGVLDAAPAVIVLDKPGYGDGVEKTGTIAALVDIRQDQSKEFSLQEGDVISVRLLGCARVRISERDEIMDENGVRCVAVAVALLKVSDELVTGIGRPSFHSPIHDLHALNNYYVNVGRCHEKRKRIYASIISARTRLERAGVDPGPDNNVVDFVYTSIRGQVEQAKTMLSPFYRDGHFNLVDDAGEVALYELGSYVALSAVASFASGLELNRAVNGMTAARDRYECALEMMIDHVFQLKKEGDKLNKMLEACGEECEIDL